jgi:hypothetical protein
MEEVMREYVPGVQVRRRGNNFRFMVFDRPYKTIFQDNPMVLLDGVPVFDIDRIMAFDPLKVKKAGCGDESLLSWSAGIPGCGKLPNLYK